MTLSDITTDKTMFNVHSPTLLKEMTHMIPEIDDFDSPIPKEDICKYIVLMYDVNSPMLREVRMFYERKAKCAEILSFPVKKGVWEKPVEDIIMGLNPEFNFIVASYIANLGLPQYTQLVAYLELQKIQTIAIFSGKISDNSDKILDRVTTIIGEITRKLFGSGETDEITAARKALYQRATIDKSRIIPRPEEIVKILEADGELPEDFNPYGEEYKVEKSRFLGDTDPSK